MRGYTTHVMQTTTSFLLLLCLLRLPSTILAYSSGAPLSACVDPSASDIYYRASTGHISNQRSSKTAWIEVYAVDDLNTRLSCVEQSKTYYVKLVANDNMMGILLGASRGIFPDMNTTQLRELFLEKVSHCPRTVTHSKKLQTSSILLPFTTSSKNKGIEFRFAVTFDKLDNLDNTLHSFPLCSEESTVEPTLPISVAPSSTHQTYSTTSTSISSLKPSSTEDTIKAASIECNPETCPLQDGERCSKVSGSRNETRRITKEGKPYICRNMNGIRTINCESSCTKDLSCGMTCPLKCSPEITKKDRKFLCTPEDHSAPEFIKKFEVDVHTGCHCNVTMAIEDRLEPIIKVV